MINTTLKHTLQAVIILCFLNCSHTYAGAYDESTSVLRFQTKMAERGSVESQYKLGFMYETGSGVKEDLDKAKEWYEKASAQGFKPASNRLVYLEIKNTGIKNEHIHWLSALKKSAALNNKDALFLLGQMYAEGTGVHKSLTLSLELLHKAARKNITSAESHITRIEHELSALQQKYALPEAKIYVEKPSSSADTVEPQKTNTPINLQNTTPTPD